MTNVLTDTVQKILKKNLKSTKTHQIQDIYGNSSQRPQRQESGSGTHFSRYLMAKDELAAQSRRRSAKHRRYVLLGKKHQNWDVMGIFKI